MHETGVGHPWTMTDRQTPDQTPADPEGGHPHRSEPMFNIPFLPLGVAVGLLGLFAVQGTLERGGVGLALRPLDVESGVYQGLVTHIIVHGGWLHVAMNALGTIAFGSPVARDLSRGFGPLGWIALYMICGIAGGLVYVALNSGDAVPVVGASGAVFGMIGASLRLMGGPGILIPLFHPIVLRSAVAWLLVTAITGLGGSFLAGADVRIAWEAHLGGFLAGMVLIGPFHRLFGLRTDPIHR